MHELGLGAEVQRLVSTHLASMDHLEVLLLLKRENGRLVTIEEIAALTGRPSTLLQTATADLVGGGLLSQSGGGATAKFCYAPKTDDLASAVEKLAGMYNERPVTLIRAIYDRPPEPVALFADAFRLRGGGR